MPRTSAKSWDEKAAGYARYSPQMSQLHARVASFARECGVEFARKSAIDVGCGTGVFSLHFDFAKLCALDVSSAMLEILRADFAQLGRDCELNCICSDFASAGVGHYDIAISTLSPALGSLDDFAKFHECAEVKIFAGWSAHRSSSLLDPVFAHFGRSSWRSACAVFEEFAARKGIAAKTCSISERRRIAKSPQLARKDILWHLQINDFAAEAAWVDEYLAQQFGAQSEFIDEISTHSNIYIWR